MRETTGLIPGVKIPWKNGSLLQLPWERSPRQSCHSQSGSRSARLIARLGVCTTTTGKLGRILAVLECCYVRLSLCWHLWAFAERLATWSPDLPCNMWSLSLGESNLWSTDPGGLLATGPPGSLKVVFYLLFSYCVSVWRSSTHLVRDKKLRLFLLKAWRLCITQACLFSLSYQRERGLSR